MESILRIENIDKYYGNKSNLTKALSHLSLHVNIGKPAINPGPQKMIEEVADKFLEENEKKAIITIYVPEGREKAKKTFNPKLGIVGGISILGSTGIVKPMSEEALKDSMFVELKY